MLRRPGADPEGEAPFLTLSGRATTPAGPNLVVEGFPASVRVHPQAAVAYVAITSNDERQLLVIDTDAPEGPVVLQTLDRGQAFHGLALTADGSTLYASGGVNGLVDRFSIDEAGLLTPTGSIDTEGYTSGLALSADEATLWVGLFDQGAIVEVDLASGMVSRRFPTGGGAVWDVVQVGEHLYGAHVAGESLAIIDLDAGALSNTLPLPTSPMGLVAAPDGSAVWAAVSGSDVVARIDPETETVTDWVQVAETDLVNAEGAPLPHSNVNALAYDAESGRLYATRGADNAVSVLQASPLQPLGALPTGWYPTGVAVDAVRQQLIVTEGKGGGAGPSDGRSAKNRIKGSITHISLEDLDLEATTAQVSTNFQHPRTAWPVSCEGQAFPIPTVAGRASPIEHVILVVKENKTFDCVFGDLDPERADVDPELLRWGTEVTPNLHALAEAFTLSDNFYTNAPNSDTGHLLLTGTHLTEYAERMWIEENRTDQFLGFQLSEAVTPDMGNLFTWLYDHGVSVRTYGEIVGTLAEAADGTKAVRFSDNRFPGGPFVNYRTLDAEKVQYVADKIAEGDLAQFTYLLLPNDHTVGTQPDAPTPESMVADNDYAVGLLVDAVSHSEYWAKTAIIVLQDDPQGCQDHVEAHRSFVLVISPWGRRGHISHVLGSFMSVFATIETIFQVPPLGRPDAAASPLWDMFTAEPDFTPFEAVPRRVPETFNPPNLPGGRKSARMNFRSPDRSPELAPLLDAYRLWKMGRITRAEAERRIADLEGTTDPEWWEELEEEAEEEAAAFDVDWARYVDWRRGQGMPPPGRPGW
ncbi:MAG: glutaminyl-peptide cyclotransferase [Bradymonadia bacterium]